MTYADYLFMHIFHLYIIFAEMPIQIFHPFFSKKFFVVESTLNMWTILTNF